MKKFLKTVNQTVQSGADAIVNAADLLMLDQIVEKIFKKVTLRIRSYDYSTILQRDDIQSIADEIFQEGYQEYDEKAGTTTDEKSNIAVRRRNLRRGFKEKLELFYRLFDEFRLQSQEMIHESQQIDALVNQTVLEVKRIEATLVTDMDTPDLLKIKYDDLKSRVLNSFVLKVHELNLVHHDQEAIAGKIAACEELLDAMKIEFLDSQEQVLCIHFLPSPFFDLVLLVGDTETLENDPGRIPTDPRCDSRKREVATLLPPNRERHPL
jgi:hypothetical protein